MNKKNIIISVIFLAISFLLIFPGESMAAGAANDIVNGAEWHSKTGLPDTSIATILINVLNWMLKVIGIIALIGFVISGAQYILAGGDEKAMEKGKKNMQYSIMGMVVVLGSFVVIKAIDSILEGNSLW